MLLAENAYVTAQQELFERGQLWVGDHLEFGSTNSILIVVSPIASKDLSYFIILFLIFLKLAIHSDQHIQKIKRYSFRKQQLRIPFVTIGGLKF